MLEKPKQILIVEPPVHYKESTTCTLISQCHLITSALWRQKEFVGIALRVKVAHKEG